MATINPNHLIEQAERLVARPGGGAVRQVDARRAISAAYYAVFHAVMTAGADHYVGSTSRVTPHYRLVYRSITHTRLKDVCNDSQKDVLPRRLASNAPAGGVDRRLVSFCDRLVELQELRQSADYDPLIRVTAADASAAIKTAQLALTEFRAADPASKTMFLSLLLFSPR